MSTLVSEDIDSDVSEEEEFVGRSGALNISAPTGNRSALQKAEATNPSKIKSKPKLEVEKASDDKGKSKAIAQIAAPERSQTKTANSDTKTEIFNIDNFQNNLKGFAARVIIKEASTATRLYGAVSNFFKDPVGTTVEGISNLAKKTGELIEDIKISSLLFGVNAAIQGLSIANTVKIYSLAIVHPLYACVCNTCVASGKFIVNAATSIGKALGVINRESSASSRFFIFLFPDRSKALEKATGITSVSPSAANTVGRETKFSFFELLITSLKKISEELQAQKLLKIKERAEQEIARIKAKIEHETKANLARAKSLRPDLSQDLQIPQEVPVGLGPIISAPSVDDLIFAAERRKASHA